MHKSSGFDESSWDPWQFLTSAFVAAEAKAQGLELLQKLDQIQEVVPVDPRVAFSFMVEFGKTHCPGFDLSVLH